MNTDISEYKDFLSYFFDDLSCQDIANKVITPTKFEELINE